jgi:hypothetical protein
MKYSIAQLNASGKNYFNGFKLVCMLWYKNNEKNHLLFALK